MNDAAIVLISAIVITLAIAILRYPITWLVWIVLDAIQFIGECVFWFRYFMWGNTGEYHKFNESTHRFLE